MDDFTIAYTARHLADCCEVDVHASNVSVAASWSWRILNNEDQDAYFETIIYPAIRGFVASGSTKSG